MKNYVKELRNKFKKYEIDGYVVPKMTIILQNIQN